MKIPKTFNVGCRTWRVKYKKRLKSDDFGRCDKNRAVIYLKKSLKRDPELLLHTFIHELVHATSAASGWRRVDDNEYRLDALAGLIAQALSTAR